jgi:hypothetical protein
MEVQPPRRMLVSPVVCVSACSSIGGGLTEVSHGGTLVAVLVSIGPATVYAVLYLTVLLVHRAGRRQYLSSSPETRQAIIDYDTASVDNAVSFLTLTPTRAGNEGPRRHPTPAQSEVPGQRGSNG